MFLYFYFSQTFGKTARPLTMPSHAPFVRDPSNDRNLRHPPVIPYPFTIYNCKTEGQGDEHTILPILLFVIQYFIHFPLSHHNQLKYIYLARYLRPSLGEMLMLTSILIGVCSVY